MIAITSEHIAQYHQQGYAVIKGFFNGDKQLSAIRDEIEHIASFIAPSFNPWGDNAVLPLSDTQRSHLYRALRYLPSLTQFAASERIIELAKQLGLTHPAVMQSYNIRMDFPSDNQFLFHWHQDLTYLLGSLNALTCWIPMTKADRQHGTIEIILASHHNGVHPIHYTSDKPLTSSTRLSPKDIVLQNEPTETGHFVEADYGDLVLFSQLLLHRSTPNMSQAIRWTVQLRYADLMEPSFIEANYPFGDATNIFYTPYLESQEILTHA